MMKLNLFATKLEENHTYIMKNIVKRIAAMGAAVMMMSSMAIGAVRQIVSRSIFPTLDLLRQKLLLLEMQLRMIMLGSTTELTKFPMLHPFHIEQRLELHILQVEKSRVKETILRNTLMRHILIKVNVFCAPCHSIQLRQV
ncbi:hypothetical protein KQH97_00010 [Ruminococcus sp. MSJ-25]|nr:hypothetical protein [Ruminococcus sp. MSJ-25]